MSPMPEGMRSREAGWQGARGWLAMARGWLTGTERLVGGVLRGALVEDERLVGKDREVGWQIACCKLR